MTKSRSTISKKHLILSQPKVSGLSTIGHYTFSMISRKYKSDIDKRFYTHSFVIYVFSMS